MAYYNAIDVAKTMIQICNDEGYDISNLRLQESLYFAWIDYYKENNDLLFSDSIYAWQSGPVVPEVYREFCPYGGRPIHLQTKFDLVAIEEKDIEFLKNFVSKYAIVSLHDLVEISKSEESSWNIIYDEGRGNKNVIPFSLVKERDLDLPPL